MNIIEYKAMLDSLGIDTELQEQLAVAFTQGKREALTAATHFLALHSLGSVNGKPAFSLSEEEWNKFYNDETRER